MLLTPCQPFDFDRTLRFILSPPALAAGKTLAPLLDRFEQGEYRRLADIADRAVLYGVSQSPASRSLQVRILGGPRDAKTLSAVRALVERQFSSSLDLIPFYHLVHHDAVLSKLAARFRGMRIPQAPSAFEALISAILEQQLNVAFAHQLKRRLIETYGTSTEFDGKLYYAFPEPATLAIRDARELRKLQISGPKAGYILGIARATLDGSLDLERLREVPPQEAYSRLLEHKGIGPWTAQYLGLRALGHLDCLPAQDVGLQKAIQFFHGLRHPPSARQVERRARAWSGWRSYATFYLWLTFWETKEWREKLREEIKSCTRKAKK